MNTKLQGRWGEQLAADYLKAKGYKIIGMGYSTRFGEIDIIAENKYVVAFVEVKLRKNDRFGQAREFVDYNKRRRIVTTAGLWLTENETKLQPRFDVVEVYAPNGLNTESPSINHIQNAFDSGC